MEAACGWFARWEKLGTVQVMDSTSMEWLHRTVSIVMNPKTIRKVHRDVSPAADFTQPGITALLGESDTLWPFRSVCSGRDGVLFASRHIGRRGLAGKPRLLRACSDWNGECIISARVLAFIYSHSAISRAQRPSPIKRCAPTTHEVFIPFPNSCPRVHQTYEQKIPTSFAKHLPTGIRIIQKEPSASRPRCLLFFLKKCIARRADQ